MRLSAPKKLYALLVAFLASTIFIPLGTVYANTHPYAKVFGGDVFAGGWFDQRETSCVTSPYYQDPQYTPKAGDPFTPTTAPDKDFYGGIIAYTKNGAADGKGSGVQGAAFSLGNIGGNEDPIHDNPGEAVHGFYTQTDSNKKDLAFANNDPAKAWGGTFQDNGGAGKEFKRYADCIPDYFSRVFSTSPAPKPLRDYDTKYAGTGCPDGCKGIKILPDSGVYIAKFGDGAPGLSGGNFRLWELGDKMQFSDTCAPGNNGANPGVISPDCYITYEGTNNGPIVVPAGKHITIYVDNAITTISRNIEYAPHTVDNIPTFTLVTRGDIFVAAGVTRLDGLYIAQPRFPDSEFATTKYSPVSNPLDGTLWIGCQDIANGDLNQYKSLNSPYFSVCKATNTKINGSLVAKQIRLLKNGGDVSQASPGETFDNSNAAESINYSPDMALGSGWFGLPATDCKPIPGGCSSSTLKIDSLTGLPPVF